MPSALQRPHVLIVSDDADLASFVGEGLVYAGLWTSTIASAMQVMEVFRLRAFDALLLDAALGGIGAAELLRRLRGQSNRAEASPRTDIPILVLAASADEIDPELSANTEVFQVLTAPIQLDHLAERINAAVAGWRSLRPESPWADEAALGPP